MIPNVCGGGALGGIILPSNPEAALNSILRTH